MSEDGEQRRQREVLKFWLLAATKQQSDEHKRVLQLAFGVLGDEGSEPHMPEQIAQIMGIEPSRVRPLLGEATTGLVVTLLEWAWAPDDLPWAPDDLPDA